MSNCRLLSSILTFLTHLKDDLSKSARRLKPPGKKMSGGLARANAEERAAVDASDLSDQSLCPPS